jgi:cytochrome P450 family 6
MFPLMLDICEELKKHIQRTIDSNTPVEAKSMAANYTTDAVGSCAFGIKCNSLENENNTFRQMGMELINVGPIRGMVLMIVIFWPKVSGKNF